MRRKLSTERGIGKNIGISFLTLNCYYLTILNK